MGADISTDHAIDREKRGMNLHELNKDDQLAFQICDELEFVDERESVDLTRFFDGLFATFLEESQAKKLSIEIEANYTGLKFGEQFEETDLTEMIKDFRLKRPIHAKYAMQIIEAAIVHLQKLPNICEVTLSATATDCVVVGDLHGHFDDLVSIMQRFNIPGKQSIFVFNGDYCDRGEQQIELLLTLLYSLVLYPNRVFLNRGNHEDIAQNSQLAYKPCLKVSALKYFGKYGSIVYSKLDELFKYLPLATIVNNKTTKQRYFIVHGGINDKLDLDCIQKLDRSVYTSVCRPASLCAHPLEHAHLTDVADMLWSDPSSNSQLCGVRFNAARNIGKSFGADVTRRFLHRHKFAMLIRSHECKPSGHELQHDSRLITLFSASNYNNGNYGAVLKISPSKCKLDLITYNSSSDLAPTGERAAAEASGVRKPPPPPLKSPASEDNLSCAIKKLRAVLFRAKEKILHDFGQLDAQKQGFVPVSAFVSVLEQYVPKIPYAHIKDRLCECDDSTSTVRYSTLFNSVSANCKYSLPGLIAQNFDMLVSVFGIIDTDNNGYISSAEFKAACDSMLKHLGGSFSDAEIEQLMSVLDKNKDNQISISEFNDAFSIACSR